MSRVIKFRAWDSDNNSLVEPNKVAVHFDGELWIKVSTTYMMKVKRKDFKLMQYTGLKDKNGVEIYEGDIIYSKCKEFDIDDIQVVEYKNGCFTVGLGLLYESLDICEVIGNIYENPELLETT